MEFDRPLDEGAATGAPGAGRDEARPTAGPRIGTSGWIYRHWRGIFYPADLPQTRWLRYFAERFDTVEVNYSFYRLPTTEAFADWAARTPPNFCFAVKGSRFITHMKHLIDPEIHVPRFFERASELGDKFGPVLWQLPPRFRRDEARLETFLAALPAHPQAIEFRDPSWLVEPVYAILRTHRVALCLANARGQTLPPEPVSTTDWTYLRFHSGLAEGGDYTDAQLRHWTAVVTDFRVRGIAVYAYFNNDGGEFALKNAARLREMLATKG